MYKGKLGFQFQPIARKGIDEHITSIKYADI
jgi:hypothetical protein